MYWSCCVPVQIFLRHYGHFLDVVSLEHFEVFHFGTKASQVLTDVVRPSLHGGGTHKIQAGTLGGIFPICLRLAPLKSYTRWEKVSCFMSVMVVFLLMLNIDPTDLHLFSSATTLSPLCLSRPRCRAVLCARQRGESLRSLLHAAGAQWDQQPSLHMAFQDKGTSCHLELSIPHPQGFDPSQTVACRWSLHRLTTDLASSWRTPLPWTSLGATSPVRGRCPASPPVCQTASFCVAVYT